MIETFLQDNKLWAKTSDLTRWEKNNRNISKRDFKRLIKQLFKLEQYKSSVITPDGIILGGNMRHRGYEEILSMSPMDIADFYQKYFDKEITVVEARNIQARFDKTFVTIVDPENEDVKREYNLSDNDVAGFYDVDLMANIMHEHNITWEDYSAKFRESDSLKYLADMANKTEEDGQQELPVNAVSEVGKIYQLGRHRLLCGDSTDLENIKKLMDGKFATLVFTDPPYNVNYDYTSKFSHVHGMDHSGEDTKFTKIFSDNVSAAKFSEFVDKMLINIAIASSTDMSFYIWFSDRWMPLLRELLIKNGFVFSQNVIWVKENFVLTQSQDYHKMFEVAAHGWKKGGKHYFNRLVSGVADVWNVEENVNLMEEGDVWIVKREAFADRIHPTQKPLKMIEIGIKKSSKVDEIVLDLFAGSGSTLMACEQLNRICYTCELDPRFVDLIRKRYATSVGKGDVWETETPALK